jgi:hypothetical protein
MMIQENIHLTGSVSPSYHDKHPYLHTAIEILIKALLMAYDLSFDIMTLTF